MTGYRGRFSILEVLTVTPEVERRIAAAEPAARIADAARRAGMPTLWDSGLNHVLRGESTVEDLLRVVDAPAEDERLPEPARRSGGASATAAAASPSARPSPAAGSIPHAEPLATGFELLDDAGTTRGSEPHGPARRVLLVDDEDSLRKVLKDLLEREGYEVGPVNLPTRRIQLEIPEGVLMSNAAATLEVLQQLQSRGFRIAVDDFGTGYSSLSYLRRFRADVLKIDRSFVHDIATNPDAAAIVSAIITLAGTLKMRAIAEGVEHPHQRESLYELGCDLMQGYLFGKPVPPEETAKLLRSVAGQHATGAPTTAGPHTVNADEAHLLGDLPAKRGA